VVEFDPNRAAGVVDGQRIEEAAVLLA